MPTPREDESKDEFVERCMGDSESRRDFPDQDQRFAFCNSRYDQMKKSNPTPSAVHVPTTGKKPKKPRRDTSKDSDEFVPPKAAQDNAKKVLRWREEHPDEINGMTEVGWRRANQLANGEALSLDTVKRISQFARHRQNAPVDEEHEGKPWADAGHVAWLGWGGDEGIEWAQRVVDEQESKTEKRSVVKDLFTTRREARERSNELGLGGHTHQVNSENGALFMPGRNHQEYVNAMASVNKRYVYDDAFTTTMEAEARSFDLGLDGSIHTHQDANGQAVYMPGATHDEYMRRMGADTMTDSTHGGLLGAMRELYDLLRGVQPKPEPVPEPSQEPIEMTDTEYTVSGEVIKVDDEQRIVYGWASVVTEKGEPVVDTQGDIITPEVMTKAVNEFMLTDRDGKVMHEGDRTGTIVHSMPITKDIAEALGIETDREGWVVGYHVSDDEVWKDVKAGKFSGFSIGGSAERIAIDE